MRPDSTMRARVRSRSAGLPSDAPPRIEVGQQRRPKPATATTMKRALLADVHYSVTQLTEARCVLERLGKEVSRVISSSYIEQIARRPRSSDKYHY